MWKSTLFDKRRDFSESLSGAVTTCVFPYGLSVVDERYGIKLLDTETHCPNRYEKQNNLSNIRSDFYGGLRVHNSKTQVIPVYQLVYCLSSLRYAPNVELLGQRDSTDILMWSSKVRGASEPSSTNTSLQGRQSLSITRS